MRGRGRSRPSRWLTVALTVGVVLGSLGVLPTSSPAAHAAAAASTPGRSLASFASSIDVAPGFTPPPTVTDLGPLPPATPLEVVVGLAPQDPPGLAARAVASDVPGSPLYHRFLSAPAADARYGAAAGDVAAATAYFSARGLSVTVHPDGLLLNVAGDAATLGPAFGTSFHLYRDRSGATFYDHPTRATLPNVARWTGVFGLSDSHAFAPDTTSRISASALPSAACGPTLYLTPCQVWAGYGFLPLLSSGVNGSGYRIGVVDAYAAEEKQPRLASDLSAFSNSTGLPAPSVTFEYPVPTTANLNASGTNAGWGLEDALDLEWTHAAAPGASLVMAFSPNPGSGMYFATDALVAAHSVDVLSMSWGEPDVGTFNNGSGQPCPYACNASTDGSYAILGPILELAAVEGISTFAASGDCGSADGTAGVSTNFPASEPWVTGVGGTYVNLSSPSFAWADETAWSGNGSGAFGAVCSNNGGSGGGFSPFPRPAWQAGPGTRGTQRGVPDVALNAANATAVIYNGLAGAVEGTSLATPIWAGIAAVADQYVGRPLGFLNPALYAVLGTPRYANAFHDIVRGSNGYHAGTGWDAVTGLGSPIVSGLVLYLSAPTVPVSNLSTFVFAAPRYGAAPLATSFELTAHGGSGSYPLEGVMFGDGNASFAVNGSLAHTYRHPGAYSAVSFVVDSSGASAASPPVMLVVGTGAPLTVGLTASTTAPGVGTPVQFNVTVRGGHSPYLANVSFGDGSSVVNLSAAANLTFFSSTHAFHAVGGYCAEAVVRDSGRNPDGGASARVALAVGGASPPACGNPSSPLTVTAATGPGIRDAPADFPGLFSVTGGSVAPGGLTANISFASSDPYISDCNCSIFRAPGAYSVSEWVNDTVNGQARGSTNVTVAPSLSATFTASVLSGPVPLVVDFAATASGGYGANATRTHWNFGNGRTAVGASARATYATPREYLALASLSDGGHGNASEAFLIDARSAGATSVGVTATVTPALNISSGANVTYNAQLVGPANTTASARLEWNLGDGDSAFGPTVTESYFAGIDSLVSDTLAAGVTVYDAYLRPIDQVPISLPSFFATESGGFVPAVNALTVVASVVPGEGPAPLAVTANATVAGPGATNVSWQFGDLGSGAGLSVPHVYYGAGCYTVVATAYDAFNDQEVRSNAVIADQVLTVIGGPDAQTGAAPLTVQFNVTALGGGGPPYTYSWTVPGGQVNGSANLSVVFPAEGHYTVSLTVTDRNGASVQRSWAISVGPTPWLAPWEVALAGVVAGAVVVALVLRRRGAGPLNP